ncbi:MAG TPA: CinA family protein [Ornithinibacter sp.]|nr:CinA family protein [Ornithinibacter sp.]
MTADAGASAVVARLRGLGLTIGTAESLTGGLVCGALTSVPGASSVVRGGVVAYVNEVKADVLRVDRVVLAREGAVSRAVALELAQGVCDVLGCDVGLSTTGVAGPDPADGRAPGTVFVGACGPWGILVEQLALTGDREQIRAATVRGALTLLAGVLEILRDGDGPAGYGGVGPERPASTDQGEDAP